MQSWATDTDEIVARIRRASAKLKIVLKTKNEPFFIKRWIDHHSNMVELENLVIFDNGSDEDAVKEVYKFFGPDLLVVAFDGFMDKLHTPEYFPELYRALRESSDFYMFIDTDEFLVCITGDRAVEGAEALALLEADDIPSIPSVYLPNYPGAETRFWFDGKFTDCLKWGKPIFSAEYDLSGFMHHNIQIGPAIFDGPFPPNFFLLHMQLVNPEQRIRANLEKLKAFDVAVPVDNIGDLAGFDIDSIQIERDTSRDYLAQAIALAKLANVFPDPPADLTEGTINLLNGRVEFFSPDQRAGMERYQSDPRPFLMRALVGN